MAKALNKKYLQNLNKKQREAVIHKSGPLLIVAGAGTGKTTVITKKLAYLIDNNLAKSEEILAVTFTEKAAGEMEERVDQILPYGYVELWISTFHAFCQRILQEHGLDIGLSTDFKLMEQTAGWLLLRKNLDKLELDYYRPMGNPTKFIHSLLNHFSRCKDEAIYPENYLEYADKLKRNFDDGIFLNQANNKKDQREAKDEEVELQRIKELANAYHIYQHLLLKNNTLDFGDLINYTLKLFEKRPKILQQYREQFKYILVDEFQDTNWAQYELIKLLAAPKNNLTVSLDDDQSLYRWRGASINNVLQFKNDYPESQEIVLTNNYRSPQNILDLSYNFIQLNNPHRLEYQLNQDKKIRQQAEQKGISIKNFKKIDKRLLSQNKVQAQIEHLHFKTINKEIQGIAEKIIKILEKDKDAGFADIAILVRANQSAKQITQELDRQRIPYNFMASKGLYNQPVILDILAYFKVLNNYYEGSALSRLLSIPVLDIPWEDLAKINYFASKKGKLLYDILKNISLVPNLNQEIIQKIQNLLELIKKHSSLAREKNIGEIFIAFLKESGYLQYLIKTERERDLNLITQFYKLIKEFEENQNEATLANFVDKIKMEIESGEVGSLDFDMENSLDEVKIMTIHSAKGLEFDYVFIPNLVDKKFPTIQKKDPIEIPNEIVKEIVPEGDFHLQEERRLFYVAMTRAKKGLFFTSADDYGGKRKKKLSVFLKDLNLDSIKELSSEETDFLEEKKERKKRKNSKIQKTLPPYFSYSQIAAFENCPLQYKFAHILKIPRKGSAVFSFGKTIHNTLYQFVQLKFEEENKDQKNLFYNKEEAKKMDKKEELKNIFELYNKNWIDDWYENESQKKEFFKKGKEILKIFLNDFINNKAKIALLEKKLGLELEFNLKIGDNIIKGKIDRIDRLSNGNLEIIDYKTGKGKEKLKKEDKKQLLIYQLAIEQIFNQSPEKLSYYYLNDGKKLSFASDDNEKESFKIELLKKIEEIKNSDFQATPGWQCKNCDFKDICEHKKL
jgi:DNA helicase II / ATP-dependent DNA helicase PcrA